ncbi:hypothetical protein K7640_05760 [Micromonospora sp. PLK6-60]|uniref:hypothetical protein n=1 Tax=Micromonospora sp. PLK6-60 TaxID=2873383 RepID=UPI001CA65C6C|nr:hypothetical protein [Micromonospora sp. PLK6-60]MBY8871347.1 hypothetical protein [Micromonospora sp. PLK6-60]
MKRLGLGLLFLGWLYGVPFLLIAGLIRRTSSPYLATHAAARSFGATTDTILVTALVLNLALPAAGLLLARLVRDRFWAYHFGWSLLGTALIFVAVGMAGNAATAPLIGWTPADQGPAPQVDQCIPISGGRGCPGG